MLDFPIWKRLTFWAIAMLALASLPTLLSYSNIKWPEFLPDPKVNMGLDLAGGSHILLEADPAQVTAQRFETMEESVRASLNRAEPPIRFGDMSTQNGQLSFMVESLNDVDRARDQLTPLLNGQGLVREWVMSVEDETRIILAPTSEGLNTAVAQAMDSATEVIRKRIDELGTREPTIIRQGDTRIVVQVPGLQDPEELKELLGKTARLQFKLVDASAVPSDVAQGIAEPGSQIYPFAAGTDFEGTSLAVFRLGGIKGDRLTGAQASVNPENQEDVVNIQFDTQGGVKFAKLSSENVNKRFAIILDDEIISAPVFREPILGGNAQISGMPDADTSSHLAIALRSGALPVDLTVVEERTVGPDLGADSIRRGMIAMMIGSVAVIVLMIATYGRFGVYSTFALIINVLMLLGLMALFKATLTLPGIAGFVLTIGAAVDANVLINERIREERKRGRRVVAAVENGYKEASRAIWDANITNVIAAVVLATIAGAGPVRGFAVVLVIGIATSIFTAVYLTRMWVADWLRKARPQELNV